MERLSDSDAAALLDFVRAAERLSDVGSFRSGILALVRELVPCHSAALFEGDPVAGRISLTVEPSELQDLADLDALSRHIFQNPMLRNWFRTGSGYAMKVTDFMSQEEFRRLDLYREFFAPFPMHFQMGVAVPLWGAMPVAFTFNRVEADFTERDRLVLDMARQHIVRVYRCAEAAKRPDTLDVLTEVMAAPDPAVVLLREDGTIRIVSGPGEEWLERYFGGPREKDRLPAAVESWLDDARGQSASGGPMPTPADDLRVDGAGGRLVLRFLPGSDWPGEHDAVLLQDRPRAPCVASLRSLGLSEREAEVLALVASGQTNAQVALSLTISERTVDKHLEHVYRKLEVPGRTAAAAAAFSALGGWAAA